MKTNRLYIPMLALALAAGFTSCEDFWTENRCRLSTRKFISRTLPNWKAMPTSCTITFFLLTETGVTVSSVKMREQITRPDQMRTTVMQLDAGECRTRTMTTGSSNGFTAATSSWMRCLKIRYQAGRKREHHYRRLGYSQALYR